MGLIGDSGGGAGGGGSHPLDGVTEITGAYSFSRDLLTSFIGGTRYTDTAGAIDTAADQTGNSRTFSGTTTARPTMTTAGPNSRACADFDGSNDRLVTAVAMSAFMSAAAGYMIISFMADTITATSGNGYNDDPLIGDADGWNGLSLRNTAGSPETAEAYNPDGVKATSATISTATAHVVEWWHDAGVLYVCVNNGTPVSGASGNSNVGAVVGLGHHYTGSGAFLDGKVFEWALGSAVPAGRSAIADDFMAHIGAV